MFVTCVYEAAELAAKQNRGSRHRPQPSQTPRGFWVHWREKRSRWKVIKRDSKQNTILLQTDGDLCCYFMMFSCSSSAVNSNHVLWCMMEKIIIICKPLMGTAHHQSCLLLFLLPETPIIGKPKMSKMLSQMRGAGAQLKPDIIIFLRLLMIYLSTLMYFLWNSLKFWF